MDERIEAMLNHNVSDKRSMVIDHAVKIEFLINGILSRILGLYESNSISFGNTSSALSFINKVHLLVDLNFLIKQEKDKLLAFVEIRNQFAHNFMVMNLSDCSKDTLNKLKKWYNPKVAVNEIKDFQPLYQLLYEDVKNAVEHLLETTIEKGGIKGEEIGSLRYNDILCREVLEYSKTDIDFKNKFIVIVNKTSEIFEDSPPSDESLNCLPFL